MCYQTRTTRVPTDKFFEKFLTLLQTNAIKSASSNIVQGPPHRRRSRVAGFGMPIGKSVDNKNIAGQLRSSRGRGSAG